jgi:hypothetical protein
MTAGNSGMGMAPEQPEKHVEAGLLANVRMEDWSSGMGTGCLENTRELHDA